MKIVLNFLGLRVGGGRTDAINILYSIPRVAKNYKFLAIVPSGCGYDKIELSNNCELLTIPPRKFNDIWRLYFDNFIIPKICKHFQANIIFTMCNNGPLWVPCRHVLMLRRPQLAYSDKELKEAKIKISLKLRFLRWYFQTLLRNVDALIVQTNLMKNLVESRYKIDIPQFIVGKNISQRFKTSTEIQLSHFKNNHNRESPKIFLYLTQYYPHKNLELACDAMLKVYESGQNVRLWLTLSSSEGPACDRLIEEIRNGKYKKVVKNIGHVGLSEIESVYKAVDAVFMPTLLESYSATFLESMAYKKPLLVSDREFAREICGDAAIYFDPLSIDSMTDAISKFNPSSEISIGLIQKGIKQFDKFNVAWDELCKQYIKILSVH